MGYLLGINIRIFYDDFRILYVGTWSVEEIVCSSMLGCFVVGDKWGLI